MTDLNLSNVSKSFGKEIVLDNLVLNIPGGIFFALLGPSGCGKTTLLRIIAGLESVDDGKIFLGESNITTTPVYKRKVNTVFQSYALFPHLNVFENVAYPLRVRGDNNKKILEKVSSALNIVRLWHHRDKAISKLSGGQQQRVALARAIVGEPKILLLDEPLGALDLRLKEQMLIELIDLQDRLGTTFIYVTHDQNEALTVADQMAIMNVHGKIEQFGAPKEIYEFPCSKFVADFVGHSNLLHGFFKKDGTEAYVEIEGQGNVYVSGAEEKNWMIQGCHAVACIRPEKISISKDTPNEQKNVFRGKVENIIYYGSSTQYQVLLENGKLILVFRQNSEHLQKDLLDYEDNVYIHFSPESTLLLEG